MQIQSLLQNDSLNIELHHKESQSRDLYILINHSAISLMQQQSKAEWIGLGDECTRMFMARIKQRKAMTSIFHIRDLNDQRVEGFEAVSMVMTRYYKELLGKSDHHITCVDPLVIEAGPSLTIEQQLQLCKPFEDTAIKNVLFSIPNHKSTGLYGFNSGFYKVCWEDIGPLVCSAINEFFSGGHLPNFFGQTKLFSLPKVINPNKAQDFRPISCCNVIYKCITKLMCNIFKEVLPHIIDTR